MTITHRAKTGGSALTAPSSDAPSQVDDKEPPKYHCDACSNDVTNTVRIRCADKSCPDFDLCVTCFCGGSEPVKHKTWHDYRVVKPHSFPIFSEEWDADEELLLIQGAEKNGIGNWQAIAAYVGTRNRDECEQHYLQVYVHSKRWPLPSMDCVFDMSEDESRERKRRRLEAARSPRKPVPINTKPITSQPTFHEIQGYMPKRCEFETEVENEAEHSVKDMVFTDDDTPEDVELKVMVLDIYNARLDKRMERKQLIFDRGWLEFKKLQSVDRRRLKEERDIHNKTRLFCRLQTCDDHDTFVHGLIREQQLRERMATLAEWRRAGLVSLKQGDGYERDKQQRLNHLKTVAALSSDRINGSAHQRGSLRAQMQALAPCLGAVYYRDKLAELAHHKYMDHDTLDLSDSEGVHLLTKEEEDMCSQLFIKPRPYLVLKDLLLKTYARQGFLKYKQALAMLRIDTDKITRLYDFFVEQGWIKHWQDPTSEMLLQSSLLTNAAPDVSVADAAADAAAAWDASLLPEGMDMATAAAMAQLTDDTSLPNLLGPADDSVSTADATALLAMDQPPPPTDNDHDDALNAAMLDPSIQAALLEEDLLAPPPITTHASDLSSDHGHSEDNSADLLVDLDQAASSIPPSATSQDTDEPMDEP
ncbi:hypothetical protein DM01DRAFT_1337129 [Hesseltinella vesiculosa]|uniref:Transcriptional adapter 2 n=1 Tax=Hesseltinella vesiculosa TaxID=101127 RepID=A0A1X2GDY3_9FUNG|nr:hypothetical protein DM01DRAFT_1337129 [Hesseltinella vesiculosa]